MPDRSTVLITAIAGDIAQGVARIVREVRPGWRLVGADIHREHAGSLVADLIEILPPATDAGYLDRLREIITRCDVSAVIPMSDAELRVLKSKGISELDGSWLLGYDARALEVGLDKLATAEFLKSIRVPAPWTIPAQAMVVPPELPCIFKPRASAGSKGLAICKSAEEAAWHAAHNCDGVFQQLLLPDEREVTCAVYRSRSGEVAVLPMLRRLAGGFTAWARVIDAPEAVSQCRSIAEALELWGPINVQMRLTDAGPRIFEINPRLSSTVYLRHLIGFSDVEWMLDEFEGFAPKLFSPAAGLEVARMQGGAILPVEARALN